MVEKDIVPVILGVLIGLLVSIYFLGYVPMKRNYDECGKVTLCTPPPPKDVP